MVKVSIILELEDNQEVDRFEKWLNTHVRVNQLTILPDTEKLYEEDPIFRAIVKEEKRLRKSKWDYINKNK